MFVFTFNKVGISSRLLSLLIIGSDDHNSNGLLPTPNQIWGICSVKLTWVAPFTSYSKF